MAGRLTPRDITTVTASQNTGCVILDTTTGGLFRSDGTNWIPENPPGLTSTDTSTVPASSYPSGTVVFDPNLGLMRTNGTTWSTTAFLPGSKLGLPRLGTNVPQAGHAPTWIAPPNQAGSTFSYSYTPTVGGQFLMVPFLVPMDGSITSVSYVLAGNGSAGATGHLAIYDSDNSTFPYPETRLGVSGAMDESQVSGTKLTWTANVSGLRRGQWIWLAYYRDAGSTPLYASTATGANTSIGGVLGGGLSGTNGWGALDIISVTTALTAFPASMGITSASTVTPDIAQGIPAMIVSMY